MNKQSYWLRFGQKYKEFTYDDFELIKSIKRLWLKHDRQATYYCNGEGFVNGKYYTFAKPDVYVGEDGETVFSIEMEKIRKKIISLIKGKKGYKVVFQSDPRGYTVRLSYKGDMIDWQYV